MGLSRINNADLTKEKESLNQLFQYCRKYNSCVFNAGAGSGKTYALVECLRYIIVNFRDELKTHNQKIACITYTNVAADNIKEKLGSSDVVDVSTIHVRLWDIIHNQQSALLKLHIEKIRIEINNINDQLTSSTDYEKFRNLSVLEKNEVYKIMIANKKVYNTAYNLKAKEFKELMPEKIKGEFSGLLSNVQKFKGLIDKLFKKERYSECLKKINHREKYYTEVKYDAMYNNDRLDKMRISHDTLLEYSEKLIKQYPKMEQLIIDRYPFILIDEYQDTANNVVSIMHSLDEYSNKIKHNFFVAYFGDSVQNIYETGVGAELLNIHKGICVVSKEYNRRSYSEIIAVANRIRNDDIAQKSIYCDSDGGSMDFYFGTVENVKRFIELCEIKWNISIKNPLHCMFATNRLVAEYSGFINVYITFKGADIYSGVGYKQLNTELLSHDVVHLGKVQTVLYKLMWIYSKSRDEKQELRNILPTDEYRDMNFLELRALFKILNAVNAENLDGLLKNICEEYHKNNSRMFKNIVESIFDIDEITYEAILQFLLTTLYKSWDENSSTENILKNLLNLKTEELLKWFHYIYRDEQKAICYHTIHGTKGLEYENVAIVLGKDFGQDKKVFESFFMDYDEKNVASLEKFKKGRNMLYVAITRAKKNIGILYIDDIKDIETNLNKIFGLIQPFEN